MMSYRLSASRNLRSRHECYATPGGLSVGLAVMSLLLSLGLVVQAWDVPSTTNQSDPQIQRRWADNREPTFSTEEARAGKLGSGGVHLHRRVEDSPSADFQR